MTREGHYLFPWGIRRNSISSLGTVSGRWGLVYLVKGCPFPQHSGNDLWILDPGEPSLLPPQLVPLRTMGLLQAPLLQLLDPVVPLAHPNFFLNFDLQALERREKQ